MKFYNYCGILNKWEVIKLAIKYKIDVMKALKEAGYTTIVLREEHHIGESAMTKFRRGEYVSLDIINRVCKLLRCQPGDIMEYVDD